ncbi:hypothetical protein RWV98_05635 [Agathobaculum sp. NTUH-O15-33]|uniref:putative ABC transporter permease n=1 Tax=Agathobaculum sp. NTUH-O15-33 TaxID=3079302 RepID=UPI002958843E|nr:hypothetical protein [Agathobaculum sp. NTUH-O15-33]WNX85749.1 hypothetical protein RWV98_05635 [Agathobaculum sp. NTUH-O15-33]
MGVLGGVCFALIGLLDEWQHRPPLWVQMIAGAVIVTALELAVGLIVNVWLGWAVWDYSDMPGNLMGQVCPQFAAAWVGLSWVAIQTENVIHRIARFVKSKGV